MNSKGHVWYRWLPLAAVVAALVTPSAGSGQGAPVSGTVADSSSGQPVGDATITLVELNRSTTTDGAGRFFFRGVPRGTFTVRASRYGYRDLEVPGVVVGPRGVSGLELMLVPRPVDLDAVVVAPGAYGFMGDVPAPRLTLSRTELESVPQFGEDAFRAVKHMPGLSGGDYTAQFSIRGGRPDQNLVLFDGLEIYEPFHLKDYNDGAFSIIDVETVGGVQLMTGGFPARYGNRASGIFAMTSREPEAGGIHYSVGASLLNARAMASGQFAGGRGSWLVSARRGYLDLILGLLKQIDLPSPSYYDAFGKVSYRLSRRNQLSLEVLTAGDRYVFDAAGTTGFNDSINTRELADNRYGNSYVWATLRSTPAAGLSVTTMASAGRVTAHRSGSEAFSERPKLVYSIANRRDFDVLGLKQDWRLGVSDAISLGAGLDARWFSADYRLASVLGDDPDDPADDTLAYYPHESSSRAAPSGSTVGAYGSARISPLTPLTVDLGVRYDRSSYTGDRDWSPRINALMNLPGDVSLRVGWGYYRQMEGIADLVAVEGPQRYFRSELYRAWTAGAEHPLAGGGNLRLEAYWKRGARIRPDYRAYRGGLDVFPETSEDWILVYPDSVESKGIEAYWRQRVRENLALTVSYGLSWVTEWTPRIDAVNLPQPLDFAVGHPGPQDQRHSFTLDVSWRPSDTWTINGTFAFHSGWPATLERMVSVTTPGGGQDFALRTDTLYGARFPAYQRLDVRVTRRVPKAHGDLRFFFEVSNLTNHENVFGYDYAIVPGPGGTSVLERDPEIGFIIMPSFGVSWRGIR